MDEYRSNQKTQRTWKCYQNFCTNQCNWWDVHQCIWMFITPLGLGVTHHCQEQVLASFTAHSSSGCSRVNICCFTANRVCLYNQCWSALHHAKEINVSWEETNLEHHIIYLPRFMLSLPHSPQANYHTQDL